MSTQFRSLDLAGAPVEQVETLIIGSGVAGVAVASKLLAADAAAQILMLEAGPKVEMRNYRLWQDYLVTGQAPYLSCQDQDYPSRDHPGANRSVGATVIPLQGARLLTYGGSTVHWGGWSFRMRPEDFQLRRNTGKGGDWPFGYAELEPHYGQAEDFIGVSGDSSDPIVPRSTPFPYPEFPFTLEDQPMLDALGRLGMLRNHLPIARHGITAGTRNNAPCQTTGTCKYCPFGARFVAGNVLDDLRDFADYPRLEVRTHAAVEQLLMDGRRRVRGVAYFDRAANRLRIVEAARVIVAAGAIESTKLLQRSVGPDWKQGVGNDHGLVGRFFMTHPYFIIQATLPSNPLRLQAEMDFPTLCSRHFDNEAEQAAGKFILIQTPSTPASNVKALMLQGKTRAQIDDALRGPTTIQVHGMLEVFGEPHNTVSNVLDARNAFGIYDTEIDYSQDPGFDARLAAISGHVGTLLAQMGAVDPAKPSVSWRADHAASTVRMAATPDQGVVDPDLKVFDVDNLWICSNAVMPALGCVNPTLTLTALALRLGDHLVGRRVQATATPTTA